MGLLRGLVLLPLTPVQGVVWLADRLAAEAEHQMQDEGSIRAQIAELAAANDRGELSDDDYDVIEEQLLRRLTDTTRRIDGEGWR